MDLGVGSSLPAGAVSFCATLVPLVFRRSARLRSALLAHYGLAGEPWSRAIPPQLIYFIGILPIGCTGLSETCGSGSSAVGGVLLDARHRAIGLAVCRLCGATFRDHRAISAAHAGDSARVHLTRRFALGSFGEPCLPILHGASHLRHRCQHADQGAITIVGRVGLVSCEPGARVDWCLCCGTDRGAAGRSDSNEVRRPRREPPTPLIGELSGMFSGAIG